MKDLAQQALELCWEIEKFPASEHQTATVLKASALHQALSALPPAPEPPVASNGICSICAGEKVLLTGEPCGCKTGTAAGEAQFLREECFKLQRLLYAHPQPIGSVEAAARELYAAVEFLYKSDGNPENWTAATKESIQKYKVGIKQVKHAMELYERLAR